MEQNRDRAEEYLVRIAEKVREMLGVDCFVKAMEVSSCGIIQPGIFIMPPKGLPSVSTVVGIIDMNNYGWDLTDPDGCAEKLVRMYAENKELLESHGFTEECVVWEKVKKLIYPFLTYQEECGEPFFMVHKCVLDFAVAYMVRFKPDQKTPWVIVKITESMFGLWSISREELHDTAMENLRREGFAAADYTELMNGTCEISPEDAAPEGELETGKMYVLTNVPMYYGAAAILDMKLLEMLSGGRNLYILPMNVHSVVVIKDDGMIRERYCNDVVQMFDNSCDEDAVRFTNHAYCYDGVKKELRRCRG